MENRCNKCGYEKAAHESCKAVLKDGKPCPEFMVFKHSVNCPKIGCWGDCEATILYAKARKEEERQRCQPHHLS